MPFEFVSAISLICYVLFYLCCGNIALFLDVEPPRFLPCPKTIFVTAAREKTSSVVKWLHPEVLDNSGDPPNVTLHGQNSGSVFIPGKHNVRYSATDKTGNLAECIFNVIVSGKLLLKLWSLIILLSLTGRDKETAIVKGV